MQVYLPAMNFEPSAQLDFLELRPKQIQLQSSSIPGSSIRRVCVCVCVCMCVCVCVYVCVCM